MEQTEEPVELVERVGALDIGKATVMACVRVPHDDKPGRRRQEVREDATRVPALGELADWLRSQGVELVRWRHQQLLEAELFSAGGRGVHLLAARAPATPRNVPGRPRTDRLDAVWLAKVARAWQVPAQPGASPADPPPA